MIVQACPSCSRQYDVSHVDPGGTIHCHCGELFPVRVDAPLRVQALSCSYCGGAVTAQDDTCPYCNAGLDETSRRETTLCPMCFTRIMDDSRHCRSCGCDIHPQALTPIPHDGECPRCEGELIVRPIGVADVIECSKCGGLWIGPEVFERVTAEAVRNPQAHLDSPDKKMPVSVEANVRYIPCLTCNELMMRRQYRHGGKNSGVVVDMCRNHGVWLDADELGKIVDFVRRFGTSAQTKGIWDEPGDGLRPSGAKKKARIESFHRPRTLDTGNPLLTAVVGLLGGLFS